MITPHNDNDDVNLTDDTVEEEVSTTEAAPRIIMKKTTPILKPALKSQPTLTRLTPMVGKNDPNLGSLGKAVSDTQTPSGSSRLNLTHSKVHIYYFFL